MRAGASVLLASGTAGAAQARGTRLPGALKSVFSTSGRKSQSDVPSSPTWNLGQTRIVLEWKWPQSRKRKGSTIAALVTSQAMANGQNSLLPPSQMSG